MDNYLDERLCDNCKRYTINWCYDSGHERDSSNDQQQCTICGWLCFGMAGRYYEPLGDKMLRFYLRCSEANSVVVESSDASHEEIRKLKGFVRFTPEITCYEDVTADVLNSFRAELDKNR